MEVKTNDVGTFICDGESVAIRVCENPSCVVNWGYIGKGVIVLDGKGM